MPKRLHHLNFIVHDLDRAARRFAALLGAGEWDTETLPGRGVDLVRFRVGETWIILVHPTDPSGVPGRYLREHGEGFFLASFEVEDVQKDAARLEQQGLAVRYGPMREGLDGWRVQDLDPHSFCGIGLQLVETRN